MSTDRFSEQMQAYGRWKADLVQAVQAYQRWLEANQMASPDVELRIFELLEALRSDQLTIAFVAEFARGKTELINAIFFSDYDRRLLPSEAGRTTMCPTELFYDSEAEQAYIRLLPIETRLDETSILEHKKNPINWTTIELDTDSAAHMEQAFQEVVRTKQVPIDEAHRLGLHDPEQEHPDATHMQIPMWRHALISFPHPLLRQGLTILDTPGLNALGSEPELTLNMLPNAQAVVFVLAADTGVTKSDLEIWQHHVHALKGSNRRGRLVVLNKVDTLWDELKDEASVQNTIDTQSQTAARLLGIDADQVFPVSAQKGLLAKIRDDQALLARSNILALEEILAHDILPQKQLLVRETIAAEVGGMAAASRDLIRARHEETRRQLAELDSLCGKNEDVIEHLMKRTRTEQVTYHKSVESFQANRKLFLEQHQKVLDLLSLSELDRLVSQTRKSMTESWTTHGLRNGMKVFFDGVTETMQAASKQVDQLNLLAQTVYRKFQQEHKLNGFKPKLFNMGKFRRELKQLHEEADAYRNSSVATLSEQSFVIKKFFITMASHARNIFFTANQEVETWGRSALAPLAAQIKDHKAQMEKRLESLRRINESRDTLQSRIAELQAHEAELRAQLQALEDLLATIHRPLEAVEPELREAARATG